MAKDTTFGGLFLLCLQEDNLQNIGPASNKQMIGCTRVVHTIMQTISTED